VGQGPRLAAEVVLASASLALDPFELIVHDFFFSDGDHTLQRQAAESLVGRLAEAKHPPPEGRAVPDERPVQCQRPGEKRFVDARGVVIHLR
jgi:hypothetical protein